jgi:hypothetical protein
MGLDLGYSGQVFLFLLSMLTILMNLCINLVVNLVIEFLRLLR